MTLISEGEQYLRLSTDVHSQEHQLIKRFVDELYRCNDTISQQVDLIIELRNSSRTNLADQEAIRAEREAEREADRLEAEAERVEQEAKDMAFRQMTGPWSKLPPETRLDYRMRARRKLGLL